MSAPPEFDPQRDLHECTSWQDAGRSGLGILTDVKFGSEAWKRVVAWGEAERRRRGLDDLILLPR